MGIPVSIRICRRRHRRAARARPRSSGRSSARIADAERVRDDWGAESFTVTLDVDPDRANLAGRHQPRRRRVARRSAMNGYPVTDAARGRQADPDRRSAAHRGARPALRHLQNLYVYARQGTRRRCRCARSPTLDYRHARRRRSSRRNQFRTITVSCVPHARASSRRRCCTRSSPTLDRFERAAAAGLQTGDRRRAGGADEGLRRAGRRAGRSRSP